MTEERFAADSGFPGHSRCLDGHFPGNPIVPGAMFMAWLADCLATTGRSIARVDRVKFVRPLGPDVPFEAVLTDETRAVFRNSNGPIAQARLVLRPRND